MAEMRIKEGEVNLIKSTFKDNDTLLKLMRKIFLPEFEADGPLGGQIDIWMTTPLQNLSTEEKLVQITARNLLIAHVETQLLQLKALANSDAKSIEEVRENLKKDSTK